MSSDENREIRSRVCADLDGTVVEIGFGSGLNVPYYPAGVHTVHAVEPASRSVAIAAERIKAGHAHVDHTGLTGERVDLPDASADAALSTWTLCSIPDVDAALAEIRRVLKPGGSLHFVEHGISPDPKVARRQGRIEPVSKPIFGGCHLTRDIPALITRAGFVIDTMTTYQHDKEPRAFGWTFEGRASVASPV
ncbi:MAG TPA: class I SAM-dependent methyltransferase [Ilumatobacteraceae bacterium]|nr:class I SAM-dependent methyltransferase [Ilumatobacteraceae bacterium]